MTPVVVIPIVVVVLAGLVALWYWRYTKAGPNEVLVISGRGRYRFVRGGTFVWPILERAETLSLALLTLNVSAGDAYTQQGVKLMVDGVSQVKVRSDEASIQAAAEQFLGKPADETGRVALQVIDGYLRAILGTRSVEDIYLSREAFAQSVRESSQADLDGMGLQIVSLTIRHIDDESGYLDALGKPRVAQVKRDAVIGESQAEQEAMQARYAADVEIARALRDKEMEEAGYAAEVAAVKAESDLAYDLNRFRKQQDVVREEIAVQLAAKEQEIVLQTREVECKERELDQGVRKPADAERYRIETLARATQTRLETEAAGEATRIRLEGEAEADAIRSRGSAEADAMKQKASSWRQYNQAAVTEQIISILPELAGKVAEPLSKTERIVVLGGGNGTGTGAHKVTQDVAQVIAGLPAVVEGLTGVSLEDLVRAVPHLSPSSNDKQHVASVPTGPAAKDGSS